MCPQVPAAQSHGVCLMCMPHLGAVDCKNNCSALRGESPGAILFPAPIRQQSWSTPQESGHRYEMCVVQPVNPACMLSQRQSMSALIHSSPSSKFDSNRARSGPSAEKPKGYVAVCRAPKVSKCWGMIHRLQASQWSRACCHPIESLNGLCEPVNIFRKRSS